MNSVQSQQQPIITNNGLNGNSNSGSNVEEENIEPPTIDNISRALVALYTSNDSSVRDYAQKWLIKIQTLSSAWDFCPQLILETNVVELQFFGASTLEQKLKNEWNSLPNEMKQRVLNMVISITEKSNKLNGIVATKMCVVLSIVAMYTYSTLWKTPIENVMQLCCPNIDQPLANLQLDRLRLVLEFLAILPQELKHGAIPCQYKVVRKEILTIVDKIYDFLLGVMTLPASETLPDVKLIIKAQSNWLGYMLPTNPNTFLNTFDRVLKATITDPSQVSSFMTMVESTLVHLDSKLSDDIEKVFSIIADRLQMVMPEFFQRAVKEDDIQGAKSICHMFVQVLLSNNSTILSKELIKRYLELLISFISVGNREFCELLFPLFDDFKSHPEYLSLDKSIIDGFFLNVLSQIRLGAMYPPQKLCEELHSIQTFRENSMEMLDIINRFTMSDRLCFVNHLIDQLKTDILKNNQHWQEYEVTLFYLSALSSGFNTKDNKIVPAILDILPTIPTKSLELAKTSIVLLGKCSNYLQEHKDCLEKVVSDMIPAFACSDLLKSASNAFLSITVNRKCASHLVPNVGTIIDLCTPHLRANQNHPSVVTLYEALLYLVHVIPTENMMPAFKQLVAPVVENINQIILSESSAKNLQLLKIQLQIIEKIAYIIEADDAQKTSHPLFLFFKFVIPQLKQLLKLYPVDCQIIESIGSIYKLVILYSKSVVLDFITEILSQVTETYARYPLAQLLQVVSAIGNNSSPQPAIEEKLTESYTIISTTTLTLLRNETKHDMAMHLPISHPLREYPIDPNYLLNFSVRPDLTREYFNMIQNALKYVPQCVDPQIVGAMTTYIIHNLLDINHLLTSRNCYSFLATVLMLIKSNDPKSARFHEVINDIILNNQHGRVLIRNLLVGVSSVFPNNLIHGVAEIFHAYASAYPTPFRKEAGKILQSKFLEGIVDPSDKQIFLNQIQRVTENKSDYKFSIQAFSILCKGK